MLIWFCDVNALVHNILSQSTICLTSTMVHNFQFGSSVGMLDKPYGELYSIPNLQSIVPQRQSRLKFMDTITKSLQIRSPALSSEASNVNVTDSDKEDDLD